MCCKCYRISPLTITICLLYIPIRKDSALGRLCIFLLNWKLLVNNENGPINFRSNSTMRVAYHFVGYLSANGIFLEFYYLKKETLFIITFQFAWINWTDNKIIWSKIKFNKITRNVDIDNNNKNHLFCLMTIYYCRNWPRFGVLSRAPGPWRNFHLFYHVHLGQGNQTMPFLSNIITLLNRYHQLRVDDAYPGVYVAMTSKW